MTNIYSPDEVEGFCDVRPIDQAVMMREYLQVLEDETKRVKAVIDAVCARAKEEGDIETDDWKLQVRYASGVSRSPDITMLEVEFPEVYKTLWEEQQKSWKPKLTKADMKWLFEDDDERKAAEDRISVEHIVQPQYVLIKKEASE